MKAIRPMQTVYVAHPYGGLAANRERAKRWFKWVVLHMGASPVADWIVMTELLDESYRELGLRCDIEVVTRCDEVWLVGGEITAGMCTEAAVGGCVRDMTSLGSEPPDGSVDLLEFAPLTFEQRARLRSKFE